MIDLSTLVEPVLYSEDNPLDLTELDRKRMKEYSLDDAWDEETREFKGFACMGAGQFRTEPCGLIYVSIEDRMVFPPDKCSGCDIKAAFG